MTITLDVSESKDLAILRIVSESPLTNFELSIILKNISDDLGAKHETKHELDVDRIQDGNET